MTDDVHAIKVAFNLLFSTYIHTSTTGEKINYESEIITDVTFNGKTKKLKLFIVRNTENLFGTDSMGEFKLWDVPISTFCQKVESVSVESESLKTTLKESFPCFLSGAGKVHKDVGKIPMKGKLATGI